MTRVGLVLGAGGVIGHAYHGAVLAALQQEAGWDAREAEIAVGTSAGSIDATLLRAGLSPRDIAARSAGETLSAEGARILAHAPRRPSLNAANRRPPAPPRWQPSSTGGLLTAARRPWQARAGTLAAAALPEGSVPTERISTGIDALFGDGWPERALWICAVRLDDGKRVVFGKDPARPRLGEAVAASCAIPGWFAPVRIGDARYVDGGAYSLTNLDVLAGSGLDLIVVISPMSASRGAPRTSFDGAVRAGAHLRLSQEIARVRLRGTRVIALEPDARELAAMGPVTRAMDPRGQAAVVHRVRESMAERLRALGGAGLFRVAGREGTGHRRPTSPSAG